MSIPFQLVWRDLSNNALTQAAFPIGFSNTTSIAQQVQVSSNAITLQTFETLANVSLYLTGNANDINTVQNIWPTLGPTNRPDLNGGFDISFNLGRTYTRFDQNHGLESNPATWIPLPIDAVGSQGSASTLGAFDTAHFLIRVVIPPGATQFGQLDIRLALDFDII